MFLRDPEKTTHLQWEWAGPTAQHGFCLFYCYIFPRSPGSRDPICIWFRSMSNIFHLTFAKRKSTSHVGKYPIFRMDSMGIWTCFFFILVGRKPRQLISNRQKTLPGSEVLDRQGWTSAPWKGWGHLEFLGQISSRGGHPLHGGLVKGMFSKIPFTEV